VVVLACDLDRFKSFNDSYGHAAGDELLRQTAHRLGDLMSADQVVGRLGGNEFAILMTGVTDVDAAIVVGEQARVALAESFKIGAQTIDATASIGIAVSHEGQAPEDLISDADTAVGIAKDGGGDRVEVLTAELRNSAQRRAHVEKMLRRALDIEDGVQVHYQPIMDLASHRVVSAEALLRVHDDEGALLSPAAFLEAANSTGLIGPLGAQVLTETCRQLAQWNEEADANAPQEITVNVSPRQLADPAFPTIVADAVSASGIASERLYLEITESMMLGQSNVVDETVAAVREQGVRIGLDDFGAGQSSLGYLKRFPLDFVKIDRGLVAGVGSHEEDTAIVRATIELAHSLGLLVVAVGVETGEQLEFLELLGCDRAQGFFFVPAVPADTFAARVAEVEA
jgi:diguanylate cyclase (GGDEF)-like protein